jgi:hypothetical protein
MSEQIRLLRAYFLLLAVFTIGRWSLGFAGARYEATHQVFSIVILAILASVHHAAFARAFLGYRLGKAVSLGVLIAVSSQLVILVSTAASYLLGLETFFNAPRALNSTEPLAFGAAMTARATGLVANTVLNSVAAAIGYALGAALPRLAGNKPS